MMPAVGAVLYGLLTGVMRFPQLWNLPVRLTLQNQSLVYSATRTMLCSLKLVLVGSFAIINRHILSGNPLPAWFTGVSLGIIFLPVLVYLIWIIKKTKEFSREE